MKIFDSMKKKDFKKSFTASQADAKEHKQKCNHAQYGKSSKNIATVAPNQQIANMGI